METQKNLNSQISLEKEWSWRNQTSQLQIILQCYIHQDSVVLAQKEKYRQMKQDRESMLSMGTLVVTKEARIYSGAKIASSIRDAGKTRQLCAKGGH